MAEPATTLSFPGFVDVHVHFRDPGMTEAETTASGLAAAARGGFAAVVTMPNTTPACDSPEAICWQRDQGSSWMRYSSFGVHYEGTPRPGSRRSRGFGRGRCGIFHG